jgi:predicted DNA-binding transcriptional regulator AlpA
MYMIQHDEEKLRQMLREELAQLMGVVDQLNKENTYHLITPEELSKILGIKRQTLDVWRTLGKGPNYLKLQKGSIRYKYSEVEKWINSQAVRTH